MKEVWKRFRKWLGLSAKREVLDADPAPLTWHPVKEHEVTDSTMYDMGWNPALLRYYVRASVAMLVKYSNGNFDVKAVALPGQAPERIKETARKFVEDRQKAKATLAEREGDPKVDEETIPADPPITPVLEAHRKDPDLGALPRVEERRRADPPVGKLIPVERPHQVYGNVQESMPRNDGRKPLPTKAPPPPPPAPVQQTRVHVSRGNDSIHPNRYEAAGNVNVHRVPDNSGDLVTGIAIGMLLSDDAPAAREDHSSRVQPSYSAPEPAYCAPEREDRSGPSRSDDNDRGSYGGNDSNSSNDSGGSPCD